MVWFILGWFLSRYMRWKTREARELKIVVNALQTLYWTKNIFLIMFTSWMTDIVSFTHSFFLSLPKGTPFDFRERRMVRKREGNIDVWEKHQWAASPMHPSQGPNPQHRHVSPLGIKPVTFQSMGWHSNQLNRTSQGSFIRSYLEYFFRWDSMLAWIILVHGHPFYLTVSCFEGRAYN